MVLGLPEDPGDVPAQVASQRRIERAERLVEQHDLRLDRKRAAEGDPLLLATGELVWIAVTKLRAGR